MAEGKDFLKMKEINDVLSDYRAQCLEGVVLQGDIEYRDGSPQWGTAAAGAVSGPGFCGTGGAAIWLFQIYGLSG